MDIRPGSPKWVPVKQSTGFTMDNTAYDKWKNTNREEWLQKIRTIMGRACTKRLGLEKELDGPRDTIQFICSELKDCENALRHLIEPFASKSFMGSVLYIDNDQVQCVDDYCTAISSLARDAMNSQDRDRLAPALAMFDSQHIALDRAIQILPHWKYRSFL